MRSGFALIFLLPVCKTGASFNTFEEGKLSGSTSKYYNMMFLYLLIRHLLQKKVVYLNIKLIKPLWSETKLHCCFYIKTIVSISLKTSWRRLMNYNNIQ